MNKRIISILVIVLLLMSMTACKKKDPSLALGNIIGTVFSKQTGDPIYGVTVEIVSGSTVKKVETNQNGQYSTAVPAGDIVITASRAGYISKKTTAVLEKNAQLNVAPITLELEVDAISIEGSATFAALLPDWSAKVYAEISIIDNSEKYADMEEIPGGTVKVSNYHIEGLKRDRNYIIVARAANLPGDAKIDGPKTQTNKNIIRKSELADPDKTIFTVNISPETNALTAAVELYLANTGRGLNDAGVDADLDAIMAAADPHQKAVDLSTTTVQGTIQDILSVPLGAASVVIIDSKPQISVVSNAVDGSFAINEVPIRYQGVRAEKAPRYIAAEQKGLVLVAGEPCDVTLRLDPNPAVIPDDLNDAAALMADNSGGALADWLTSDFSYTYMTDAPKDKATAMSELDTSYVVVRPGPVTDYDSIGESKTEFNFDNKNWIMRRAVTYVRYGYNACGMVRYGNKRWQLVSLTVGQEERLPKAPATLTATTGDATAALGWTAPVPNDPEITGYKLYRTPTATEPADTALPIASVNIGAGTDNSYVDSSLSTGRYYYWVRSVDKYSVDEYSEVEIPSDYSPCKEVYVVNALETVQQFVAYALAGNKDAMISLLADNTDFKWKPVGEAILSSDKTRFVNYMYDQFNLPASSEYPARQWELQLDSQSFSRIAESSTATIAVPGSLAGRYGGLYTDRNRRWLEAETWKVSLLSGKLLYFDAGARELYPGAPTAFLCTNMRTMEVDGIVELEWQVPDDPLLAGYRVYRHDENDFSNAIQVGSFANPASTEGSVEYVTGEQIYYWLVAFDTYGEISAPSNPVLTGVPNDIRELAENFLQASFNRNQTEVRKFTTADFYAYLLEAQYSLASYCNFTFFNMAPPPYEIAFYRVVNPDAGGTRYELTFIVKGGGTICTWLGTKCTNIVVQIASVNDEWRVFAANFLN